MKGIVQDNVVRVKLVLVASDGQPREVDATLDTGFDRYLSLPRTLIDDLGYPFADIVSVTLADKSIRALDMHIVRVVWHGRLMEVPAYVSELGPLIGMALLTGSEVRIRVISGGTVTVEPLD